MKTLSRSTGVGGQIAWAFNHRRSAFEVGACTKYSAFARQDDRTYFGCFRDDVERRGQLVAECLGQGIDGGIVEAQHSHVID